jgi:hypothetical protein
MLSILITSNLDHCVCSSLNGNTDGTVMKVRGCRLGARVLFLRRALGGFSLLCPELLWPGPPASNQMDTEIGVR